MAIEKVITYDHAISENGRINVREITTLVEDGKVLHKYYHRHIVDPKTADVTNEDERTRRLTLALTAEISETIEEVMEDGVIDEEEKETLKTKFLKWIGMN